MSIESQEQLPMPLIKKIKNETINWQPGAFWLVELRKNLNTYLSNIEKRSVDPQHKARAIILKGILDEGDDNEEKINKAYFHLVENVTGPNPIIKKKGRNFKPSYLHKLSKIAISQHLVWQGSTKYLESEISNLKDQLRTLAEIGEKKDQEILQAKETITTLSEDKKNHEQLSVTYQQKLTEIKNLKNQLITKGQEVNSLLEDKKKVEKRFENILAESEKTKNIELNKLTSRCNQLEKDYSTLEADYNQATETNQTQKEKIKNLETESKKSLASYEAQTATVRKLIEENRDYQDTIKDLESESNILRRSFEALKEWIHVLFGAYTFEEHQPTSELIIAGKLKFDKEQTDAIRDATNPKRKIKKDAKFFSPERTAKLKEEKEKLTQSFNDAEQKVSKVLDKLFKPQQ